MSKKKIEEVELQTVRKAPLPSRLKQQLSLMSLYAGHTVHEEAVIRDIFSRAEAHAQAVRLQKIRYKDLEEESQDA